MMQVTADVVKEFAADNVKYLELRTTPRDVPATRMTKSSHIASVVAAINAAVASEDVIVRLLLAVDRRMGPADIDETLKLAESYASQSDSVVVGLDLSGNPMVCNYVFSLNRPAAFEAMITSGDLYWILFFWGVGRGVLSSPLLCPLFSPSFSAVKRPLKYRAGRVL